MEINIGVLLAVAHRAVKTAKYSIPYTVNLYIQWSVARQTSSLNSNKLCHQDFL